MLMLVLMVGAGNALSEGIASQIEGFATNSAFFSANRTTIAYKGFQKGELVNLRFIFGYEIKNEKVEINPEEAAIVRMIFDDYISGMGGSLIARKLRGMNVPTVFDVGWDRRRVIDVIRNEKYVGNALLQKKYVTDHLSKARVRNKGELPMYYAKGTHPPIIDADTFDRAQAVLEKRRKLYAPKVVGRKRYPFSGIIYCGNCGRKYKRKTGNRRPAWQCSTYLEQGKAACQAKQIPEATLRKVAAEVLELDSFDKEAFAKNIEEIISFLISLTEFTPKHSNI